MLKNKYKVPNLHIPVFIQRRKRKPPIMLKVNRKPSKPLT